MSDENVRRRVRCSNMRSLGPQPVRVIRDIRVCCGIISYHIHVRLLDFSREPMRASAREGLLAYHPESGQLQERPASVASHMCASAGEDLAA